MQTVDLRNTPLVRSPFFPFEILRYSSTACLYNDMQNQDAFLVVSIVKIKGKILLPITGLFIILGNS